MAKPRKILGLRAEVLVGPLRQQPKVGHSQGSHQEPGSDSEGRPQPPGKHRSNLTACYAGGAARDAAGAGAAQARRRRRYQSVGGGVGGCARRCA